MRTLTPHGEHNVRIDTVPDPEIVNPRAAIDWTAQSGKRIIVLGLAADDPALGPEARLSRQSQLQRAGSHPSTAGER